MAYVYFSIPETKHLSLLEQLKTHIKDHLLIINTNGKLIKKCEISRNLKSMVLFDNGNTIGLIFRDKIEFIKI